MTITIPYYFSDISVSTKQNGDLELELNTDQEVIRQILLGVLQYAKPVTLIESMDKAQLEAIKNYTEE